MGIQIDALPHTCGTTKGLKVFAQDDGSVSGYCFACSTFVADPYEDGRTVANLPPRKEKSATDIAIELAEVDGYPTVDVPVRKLRAATLEKFGAKVSLSETDGITPTAIYWPTTKLGKPTGYHVKVLARGCSPFNIGDTRDCDLINWTNARESGAYKLIVTEGAEDMASVSRMFEMHGNPDYVPAVVSLPHGAASAKKCLGKHAEDIRRLFKEVILCFDNDEAGQLAVKKAMLSVPFAKSVILPCKDANQCLIEGKSKAAYNALSYHAEKPKNTSLVFGESVHESARQPTKRGELTWFHPDMDRELRGIRYGETIYIGAAPKIGKGEFRNELVAHLIKNHGAKVFVVSPEESNNTTYKLIAGKLESRVFTDPDKEFDFEAFDRAGELLKNHLSLVNVYQMLDWQTLRKDIVAAAEWGAKVIIVDPITNLSNGVNSAEANTLLQGMSQDLSAMALDLDVVIFLFCHTKANEGSISPEQRASKYRSEKYIGLGNCSQNMGGDVTAAQFAGSRAMERSCNLMLALLGNQDPELPIEIRNKREIQVLADRAFGNSSKYKLFWNKNNGRFENQ